MPPRSPALLPLLAPIPQVQVTLSAPPSVSAGNFLGDTYTITVRNGSPSTTAFNFFITATIPAAGFNYVVGSGNLVISKSPTLHSATFGDVISWTIEAANTGLGTVYSATVGDLFGSGYTTTDASQLAVSPFTLAIGERRSFVVTATVNSCTNLTNTALASWSIGNDEGEGTAANPVSDTVDVLYLLEEPNISLTANNLAFAYCSPTPQTVVVTATNTGGAARNFALDSNLEG